jgi:hypothetical protein
MDTAASPRQPVELPDAVAGTDHSATPQQANKAAHVRSSPVEADPLMSLLRSGTLPPAPVVSGKRKAKAEKASLKKAELERAQQQKAKAEMAKYVKAQLAKARLENAEYEKKALSERAKFAKLRAESEKLVSVLPERTHSGNAKSNTPPQANSLLSVLRKEMLATEPDVSGNRDAKAQRTRLELDKFDSAKLENTGLENEISGKIRFQNEQSEDAESVTSLPGDSAHSGWFSVWTVGVAVLLLACVAGLIYLSQSGLFR